jgi:2-phosphoglycerate kinase
MTTDQGQHRVILIFGNSGHGKSTLAAKLQDKYGYHLISLDELYVKFIREHYPDLFLPILGRVIGQHYDTMFHQNANGVTAWCEHVASVTKDASSQNRLLAVEGYLLSPALTIVQESLTGLAAVTTVEVRNGQYFVASSVEQIHG